MALPSLHSSIQSSLLGILNLSSSSHSSSPSLSFLCFQRSYGNGFAPIRSSQSLAKKRSTTLIRAVEEETLIPETQEETSVSDQPVSVPVSPSDMLTMFFQAEGTMSESDVPKVIAALEQIEGVSDLQVRIVESIAIVELTKQTTVQSTGVASSLVEVIQGSGFKLQTLNLSFKDEEDNV